MKDLSTEEGVATLSGDPRRQLVARVVHSTIFRRSPRLQQTLEYLAGRALESPDSEVSEYEIAEHVFDRAQGFDPSQSNIVRVTVREVRRKLAEYFDEEGATEPVVIEVPKGAYAVRFVTLPSDPAAKIDSATPPPRHRTVMLWKLFCAALGIALAGVSVALWRSHEPKVAGRGNESFLAAVTAGFLGPTTIVLNDSAARLVSRVTKDQIALDDYANRRMLDPPPGALAQPELRDLVSSLRISQMTSLVNALLVYRIGREIPSVQFSLRHSRDLSARDFYAGNFLFLSANNSTPWASLFQPGLNFSLANTVGPRCVIANRNPRSGERAEYAESADGSLRTTYGRAALISNLAGTGKVLLVEGINMEATEAVMGLFLDPTRRAEIERAIGVHGLEEQWEVLVQAKVISGSGGAARIIAARVSSASRR